MMFGQRLVVGLFIDGCGKGRTDRSQDREDSKGSGSLHDVVVDVYLSGALGLMKQGA